uniref:Uncharacterized protein n=1 Tax=Tanacetum cinerariifolium TaxID=118510 RepID=A0A6L2MUM9_TANCI|nr:hypothetical protein [Tanacetum cinerariifolium]
MSTSTHPITILSDSDIKDAFSSTNTPDYILASPDYFPASTGNTFSDPSEDLSNNESPILLPQAPIAPPNVLPSSQVLSLSPMFDPRDFFLPEEILPPQKQARFLSSSSTDSSAPAQILWAIIHRSNTDYVERIWEEFVQSIQTFLADRKNLTTASRRKKKTTHLLILNVRFVGNYGIEIFGMSIPDALLTDEIKGAPYYGKCQEHVAKYHQYLDVEQCKEEEGGATESPKSIKGPARPVVIRDPDSGKIQLLPDVQGKGKEKRRTPMPTKASGHAKSPSLDAILALTDNEMDYDNVVSKIDTKDQDEGRARPNPRDYDEGQAGPNPGATNASTQQNPEQMDEEFTITAYPNNQENLKLPYKDPVILEEPASSTGTLSSLQIFEKELKFTNQFFVEKQQKEEPGKTNVETLVQSMVSVLIHQETSSIPLMTTLVIDLTIIVDPTLVKCIDELEQHMANLLRYNLALEERLDKHRSWLYKLENLNIPHQVSKAVDEIVIDAVDWAHEDYKKLYDALEKSLERDYSDQLLSNLEEARQKKRKRRDLPRTPFGSPPPQPPPLPPYEATSSSKSAASAPQSMAWTTYDTRYESVSVFETQELSLLDSLFQEDSFPDEQVHLFDDETPRMITYQRLIQEKIDVEKNWVTALVSAYETPAENSLLAKTGDIMNFLNWYCRQVNKTELTQEDLEGQAYKVVKAFYLDVIHLQFQMEECHKMLTDQVDWTNPEGDQVRVNVN